MIKYMVYPENDPITLNHHRNMPFHSEGANKARESKIRPYITQPVDIPLVYSLQLSKVARDHSTTI